MGHILEKVGKKTHHSITSSEQFMFRNYQYGLQGVNFLRALSVYRGTSILKLKPLKLSRFTRNFQSY